MLRNIRSISIAVCDLDKNPICIVYDSAVDIELSAYDIFVKTQRNGSKVLSFSMPSQAEDGTDNWRLQYMLPEYKIRTIIDDKEDYFILSNDSIAHDKRNKKTTITAQHSAMTLKYKCLDKEYDGQHAESVGTANMLCTSILEGTDWSYDADNSAIFYEKDGITEKYRTLKCSAKTGAFAIIAKVAELFDAKPVYDGSNKTVKLIPMNPFKLDPITGLPDTGSASTVLPLYYGTNVRSMSRTRDSENMVTRLNVQGAWGDSTIGYCGIEELSFDRYSYVFQSGDGNIGITYKSIDGSTKTKYFATASVSPGDTLIFNCIDRVAESYVWDKDANLALPEASDGVVKTWTKEVVEPRNFSFLMDFSYYVENGMMTDTMLQAIATFQIEAWDCLETIREKTETYNEDMSTMYETIGYNSFVKLSVDSVSNSDGYKYLNLNLTGYPDNGVIYTSEVDTRREEWFTWREATGINNYNVSINSEASVLYIMRPNGSWKKTYIKSITKNADDVITGLQIYLPDTTPDFRFTDAEYYLFSANTINGLFGALETQFETIENTCQTGTTTGKDGSGIPHTVFFEEKSEPATAVPTELEWSWRVVLSNEGDDPVLYFYGGKYGDVGWNRAGIGDVLPSTTNTYKYFYNYADGLHYRAVSGAWEPIFKDNEVYTTDRKWHKQLAEEFTTVWAYVCEMKMIVNGQYQTYTYTAAEDMPIGNYFTHDDYQNAIVFSTDYILPANESWTFNTTKKFVTPSHDETLVKSYSLLPFQSLRHHHENEIPYTSWSAGTLNRTTGEVVDSSTMSKTGYMTVYEDRPYTVKTTTSGVICYYTLGGNFVSGHNFTGTITENVPHEAAKVRIAVKNGEKDTASYHHADFDNYIIYQDRDYKLINPIIGSGTLKGLVPLCQTWRTITDKIYLEDWPEIKNAQDIYSTTEKAMINVLGDQYKQGFWVDDSYIDGQEQKLFDDAVENLDELAKPKTIYNVNFLDLYSADDDDGPAWPDIDIDSAVHISDPELNIDQWAFLDVVNKCYDAPWKTQIQINTNLTEMTQSTFQDVMSNLQAVADETKLNAGLYDRAAALTSSGGLLADKIEGKINADRTRLSGGSSTWETDDRGNMLFSSAVDNGHLMITGDGILVASNTDEYGTPLWRTAISGEGISADEITTGTLNANLIEAGSITVDKLSATAGEELDISSNTALWLYATVDGSRPAGAVNVRKEGESFIAISPEGIVINSGADVLMTGANVDIKGSTIDISTDDTTGLGGIINMTAQTQLNVNGGDINVGSSGGLNVLSTGNIDVASGGSVNIHATQDGAGIVMDDNGVTVNGTDIKLLTNSGVDGRVVLGSEQNYITSLGLISLHNGDLTIDGATGNIDTSGNLNLNSGANLTATGASVNIESGSTLKVKSGADMTINSGGSLDIKSGSDLTISSPNFTIDSDGNVSMDGTVYATAGRIGCDANKQGGWIITNNKIYSGSGNSYVELNSDSSSAQKWAILVGGNNAPDSGASTNLADFAVRRDGAVVLSKVMRYKSGSDHSLETMDLRASLWQMDYAYNRTVEVFEKTENTDGTVTLTLKRKVPTIAPDLSVTFNSAAQAWTAALASAHIQQHSNDGPITTIYPGETKTEAIFALASKQASGVTEVSGTRKTVTVPLGSLVFDTYASASAATGSVDAHYQNGSPASNLIDLHGQLTLILPTVDTDGKVTSKARVMSNGKYVAYETRTDQLFDPVTVYDKSAAQFYLVNNSTSISLKTATRYSRSSSKFTVQGTSSLILKNNGTMYSGDGTSGYLCGTKVTPSPKTVTPIGTRYRMGDETTLYAKGEQKRIYDHGNHALYYGTLGVDSEGNIILKNITAVSYTSEYVVGSEYSCRRVLSSGGTSFYTAGTATTYYTVSDSTTLYQQGSAIVGRGYGQQAYVVSPAEGTTYYKASTVTKYEAVDAETVYVPVESGGTIYYQRDATPVNVAVNEHTAYEIHT